MQTLIRSRVRHLIWVCTVCQCSSPGLSDNSLYMALCHRDKHSVAINNRYLNFVKTRDLISLVNNYHVDNNLKEILEYVYLGSVNPKTSYRWHSQYEKDFILKFLYEILNSRLCFCLYFWKSSGYITLKQRHIHVEANKFKYWGYRQKLNISEKFSLSKERFCFQFVPHNKSVVFEASRSMVFAFLTSLFFCIK